MKKGGTNINMSNDNEILQICYLKRRMGGPWIVVAKDIVKRWAIVAADWDNSPCLAIRWFWSTLGTPVSNKYPIWFIIPDDLAAIVINGLQLNPISERLIEDFLTHKICGMELKTKYMSK